MPANRTESLKAVERVREDMLAALNGRAEMLSALKGDTLVVTGGTGFVGTWITEAVAALNDQHGFGTKLVLVSRSTEQFRLARPHLASRKDVQLVKSDVRHLNDLPRETGFVLHAAANPDSRFHSTNPIEAMATIAEGTTAVLRAADRCGSLKRVVNVSSALVYGSQPWEMDRVSESYNGAPSSNSVSSAYAEAKRYAETLCAAARSQARIPVVTARPFAFMGPYQGIDSPWAINNFIRDAIQGNPIRVFGDGQTVRSYLYGSDMAVWMLRILAAGEAGSAYNVGSPEGFTLQDLAEKVSQQFSPRPEIRLRTAPQHSQPNRLVPEVSAARALGLDVTVPIAQAIEKTVSWNRDTL